MATKYAHLPDIDTAQDVYETPDIIDSFSKSSSSPEILDEENEETHNSNIDTSSTKPSNAAVRFVSSEVDAKNVDFSGKVGQGTSTRAYRIKSRRLPDTEEYEMGGLEKENETKFQKLRRLLHEVKELENEVEKDLIEEEKSSSSTPGIKQVKKFTFSFLLLFFLLLNQTFKTGQLLFFKRNNEILM